LSTFPTARRTAAGAFLIALMMAGCSGNSIAPTGSSAGAGNSVAGQRRSLSQYRALSNGQGIRLEASPALIRGWMSPEAKTDSNAIYWGNYDTNTITIYSSKGVNGKELGQITTGLSNPERLFVDKNGSVYATNIGNNTVTAYKAGATTPFLTISTGIDGPTGLTVDAAGTVYVANVNTDTITEYPKGKTAPSITIDASAEYLATDANDNLYAAEYPNVEKYAKGSSSGTSLGLSIGSPGALEVDGKGTIIVLDESNDDLDYFPVGKTLPSKQVALGGFPFGIALSKNNKQIYISNSEGSNFLVQTLRYPNGTAPKTKLSTNVGGWPISVNPNNVLGK
jgi:DNA-binding beta-propeller fold protein YncE